jgi:hypothetical protein
VVRYFFAGGGHGLQGLQGFILLRGLGDLETGGLGDGGTGEKNKIKFVFEGGDDKMKQIIF